MGTKTIGIDFGTNFLCVAALVNGKVEVIPNEHEKRLTPCFVAFTDEERLFGETAKHQAALNHENTIYNIKQLLACKTKKPINLSELTIGFAVDRDENGEIQIPITNQKEPIKLHPQQIAAMIIKRLKELAETYLGNKVDTAVISVPAGFDEIQRRAIINAGRIAGFDDISLIKETTAAVLAYAFDHPVNVKETILVVDFGGSSIEICVATIQDKKIKILAIEGNISVGGEIIDDNLVDHYLAKFEKENITISSKKKDMVRLKEACEKIKRNISAAFRARFPNNIAMDLGLDPSKLSLTKEEFETINEDINKKVEEVLVKVLQTKKVDKKKIDQIILVGGSTRIPMVRKILEENFKGKTLNRTINPDEAVALGAAIHAASLNKTEKSIEYVISDEREPKPVDKVEKANEKWIKQLIESNKKFDDNDEKFQKESTARNSLEQKAYSIKQDITKRNMQNKEEELLQKCDEAIKWLNDIEDFFVKDCQERIDELQGMWKESKVRQQNTEKVKEKWRSTPTKIKNLHPTTEKSRFSSKQFDEQKIETPTSLLKLYIGSVKHLLGDASKDNYQLRKDVLKKCNNATQWLEEKQRSDDEIKAKKKELKEAWADFDKKNPKAMKPKSPPHATKTPANTSEIPKDVEKGTNKTIQKGQQVINPSSTSSDTKHVKPAGAKTEDNGVQTNKTTQKEQQVINPSSTVTKPEESTAAKVIEEKSSKPTQKTNVKAGKPEANTTSFSKTGPMQTTLSHKSNKKEVNDQSTINASRDNKTQQPPAATSTPNKQKSEGKSTPNVSPRNNVQQQPVSANQKKQQKKEVENSKKLLSNNKREKLETTPPKSEQKKPTKSARTGQRGNEPTGKKNDPKSKNKVGKAGGKGKNK